MTCKEFLYKVVQAHSGVSSKRLCGLIGWLIILLAFIYCTLNEIQAPEMVETFSWCCMALLGIDSVSGIFKKNESREIQRNDNSLE